jgi:hypothetical protein
MKWKRSKKAQQEAKSKDNHNSDDKLKNSSSSNKSMPINNTKSLDVERHTRLESNNSMDVFNTPHKLATTNLEHQHQRQLNLITSNLKEFSNSLEDNLPNTTLLTRRPLMFPEGTQNGETMFRPYVV